MTLHFSQRSPERHGKCFPSVVLCAIVFVVSSTWTLSASADDNTENSVDFNRDIRPLLSDRCFFCHGPDAHERQADLRLDTAEGIVQPSLGDLPIVTPGHAGKSELFQRIVSDDSDLRMPPADSGKQLTAKEIALIKQWIEQGAPFSKHWAYETPKESPIPNVRHEKWPINWIDNFVVSHLEKKKLVPSAEADKVTLIRRLYFDLIGLPPKPDEVAAFLNNDSPAAYEQLVDKLLASDHYGEKMAMYWLDLVRYADTVGYHGDQDHNISPYRDYVIDAFNHNLPFDQFTAEQLAGDLLPDSNTNQKVASGYNRFLQTSHEGGVQKKEYLAIYAADRVRNVSGVWLGSTMGCCQCHDHKYDPYTAKDFYSMVAFFADLDEAQHFTKANNALPTRRAPEINVLSKGDQLALAKIAVKIADLNEEKEKRAADSAAEATEASTADIDEKIAQLIKQQEPIKARARLTMVSVAIEPRTIRILPRGDWLDDSGEIVEPAVPAHLGSIKKEKGRANRLDLARWLTNTEADKGVGLLTARVFANRFWYQMMGVGISKTLDDLGAQGQAPTHPELLDNLAISFANNGWDVKKLIKLIVMSRTYRQSSLSNPHLQEIDPQNRLYARQSRFRLPAETIRDNALAISGLLVTDIGGGSIRPYQPAGYYRHLNFPTREYKHDTDSRQYRRGVYMHWQRQFLHPMLKAFDAPSREECTAQRPRSNTPLAALALLNDPSFVEAARVFAAVILHNGGDSDSSKLEFAYKRALSRMPDALETKLFLKLLQSNREHYQQNLSPAKELISTGLSPVDESLSVVEQAAWTSVARAVLNLNETISRN